VNEKAKNTNKGLRFDEEFKRSAVEMLESGGRSATQLGAELGISSWSLGRWKKIYGRTAAGTGPDGGGGPVPAAGRPADLVSENARLRRELEVTSRQRDILKKACAILGQEPWNASR
jgi:transposase